MKAKPIRLLLAPALYRELAEMAAKFDEPGFGPTRCAEEILVSELASRRLPKVERGAHGARPGEMRTYHVPFSTRELEAL